MELQRGPGAVWIASDSEDDRFLVWADRSSQVVAYVSATGDEFGSAAPTLRERLWDEVVRAAASVSPRAAIEDAWAASMDVRASLPFPNARMGVFRWRGDGLFEGAWVGGFSLALRGSAHRAEVLGDVLGDALVCPPLLTAESEQVPTTFSMSLVEHWRSCTVSRACPGSGRSGSMSRSRSSCAVVWRSATR